MWAHNFLFKKHDRIEKLIQLAITSEKFKEKIAGYALGNTGFYSIAFKYFSSSVSNPFL